MTSPPTTISTDTSSITVPTTLICIGIVLRETPQTYIGNVVVLPAFRLVMMKSSNDSEKLSIAAAAIPGSTSGKVTRQKVWFGSHRDPPLPVRGVSLSPASRDLTVTTTNDRQNMMWAIRIVQKPS